MADVVEFVVKMRDLMSGGLRGVAANAQASFRRVDGVIASTQQRIGQLGRPVRLNVETGSLAEANRQAERLLQTTGRLRDERGRFLPGGGSGSSGGSRGSILPDIIGGNLISGGIERVAGMAKDVIAGSINAAMDFGKNAKSFEVLTGSVSRGKELVNELRKLKQETIMGASVYKNAQTMMGFGISDKEVVRNLRMIGDVAMGDQEKMGSLTLAFSQTRAAGRLMGQDLLQYINAGFNPLGVMSERWKDFGFKQKVTVGQLKEMMEKGKISADAVTKSFELATSKGGRFYNMMDQIGETAAGKMQKLKGNWAAFQIDLGNALMPYATSIMEAASDTLHFLNISKTAPETLLGEKLEIDNLIKSITDLNQGNEIRGRMIDMLRVKYPDLFGNLDREKTTNQELLKTLNDINGAYDKRIKLAEYDLVSDNANKEIKELMDLATKARVQADYSEQHKGYLDRFKYLGAWDQIKMDMGGIYYDQTPQGLRGFSDQAMLKIQSLQGTKSQAEYKKRAQSAQDLAMEGSGLLKDPNRQKELWGTNAAKNKALLQRELGVWNALVLQNQGKFTGSLLNHDLSKLQNLLHPSPGQTSGNSGNVTIDTTDGKSKEITGGGIRSIVFNIQTLGVSGGMTMHVSTVQEGASNLRNIVVEELNRALDSVGGAIA